MRATTWSRKAAADLLAVETLRRASTPPIPWDIICFHAPQAIEKWIKGWLSSNGIRPPRTHDLARLVDLGAAKEPRFAEIRIRVASLTEYAVAARYPDEPFEPGPSEAEQAIVTAKAVRVFIERLGPPPPEQSLPLG